MSGHKTTAVPTTLAHAQSLGHQPVQASNSQIMQQGISLVAAQGKPGDLCHIGLCDPDLHTRVNWYLDANLNCNVAVTAPC